MQIAMAEARIDLAKLRNNIAIVRKQINNEIQLLFPVKADAYGHGAVQVAKAAENGVDYFGVANIIEALELRQNGIRKPILILFGARREQIPLLVDNDITASVSDAEFAYALGEKARNKRPKVHICVDTGIGRQGILPDRAVSLITMIKEADRLEVEGIFSHFSVAYSTTPEHRAYTQRQLDSFLNLLTDLKRRGILPPLRHIANSAGLLQFGEKVFSPPLNMVRPGVLLHGYCEFPAPWTDDITPTMSMHTWITAIREIPKGSAIGYGCTYYTPTSRRIATLPVGYADGMIWRLSNQSDVVIRGARAPIVGRISMDLTTVDVSDIPAATVGDEVELLGVNQPADLLANRIDAAIEVIFTAISKRVPRVYLNKPTE
ncbi:alanine racemase [Candidatus Acetothermia bacterium]|nr:alanine racemase [Candidatus Acetothermia bacterium]